MSVIRRAIVVGLTGLAVLGLGLALDGAPASAAFVHHVLPPEEGFGPSFARATGVAVDQASENVFVVDSGSEAECRAGASVRKVSARLAVRRQN